MTDMSAPAWAAKGAGAVAGSGCRWPASCRRAGARLSARAWGREFPHGRREARGGGVWGAGGV